MRRRLAFRLTLSLAVIVAVVEGVFGYVNIKVQERQLLDEMVLGADQLSRSLTGATWHAMLADRREDAYDIMQVIGQKQGIESVRIFNKEGRVTFSTEPNPAHQVDKNAEACFMCHAREQPLVRVDVPSRARIFSRGDGRMMGFVTAIYNEPACSRSECHAHPASKNVLGVLDITMDLGHVDRKVGEIIARSGLMTAVTFVLLTLAIVFTTRRLVGRPIGTLIQGTRAISRMNLDEPIAIESSAELHELATSFNLMRERLKAALSELNASAEGLERKVEERTQQLGVAQQRLAKSERLASLGQLAASVAHEINNPISGVLNLSMLLQRILGPDGVPKQRVDEFRRYLRQVSDETARVGRIVSDLLAFSRRSAPGSLACDLNAIVTTTLSLIHHKLELGKVQLDVGLAPALPPVRCDRSQIQQVVLNLVMNGAEAMPAGGRLTVRTAYDQAGDSVVLEVGDEGGGIPDSVLPRIFEPFFTTKEPGKGVGLGLAVVYGIVQAHHGSIDIDTTVGAGTVFTVTLPRSAGRTDETGTAPAGSQRLG